jgi:hypothetical protein
METCRQCGAFLMQGWDRCRICGFDPAADPAAGAAATPGPPGAPGRQPPGAPLPPGPGAAPTRSTPGWLGPAALATVLVVLAGAAYIIFVGSGDDGPASRQEYVDALVFSAEDEAEDLGLEVDWDCVAGEAVDAVGGPEALHERGVEPGDLTGENALQDHEAPDGAAARLAAALPGCGLDGRALLGVAMAQSDDESLTPELTACIVGAIDPTVTDEGLAAALVGDPAGERETEAFEEHIAAVATMCGR